MDFVKHELARLRAQGLLRGLKTISAINGARVKIDSKWYLSFCSNDYLGLTQHSGIKQAVHKSVQKFGGGSGASATRGNGNSGSGGMSELTAIPASFA